MKNFPYLGPSIVVLAAGAVALVVAPMVVRSANDARATVEIAQASNLLSQGVDIAPVGFSRQTADALVQEGARDPLDDSLHVRGRMIRLLRRVPHPTASRRIFRCSSRSTERTAPSRAWSSRASSM